MLHRYDIDTVMNDYTTKEAAKVIGLRYADALAVLKAYAIRSRSVGMTLLWEKSGVDDLAVILAQRNKPKES